MASLSVMRTLVRELCTRKHSPRINEPDLVMDDPEKVAAYTRAGREDGVMAPVYLFHSAQICEVVRPGDTVLDLGCGPATQLAMAARLNPDTNFIGVDLSAHMLDRAQDYVNEQNLGNVTFQVSDISDMSCFADNSVNAVVSTVALHHLPELDALDLTFKEIQRILKPGGGLYLVDFGHLKSEKSIDDFANQYAHVQAELFTLDYLYSLRAAFSPNEFKHVASKYLPDARVSSTFLMPFMVAVKNVPANIEMNPELKRELHDFKEKLPGHHKTDLADLMGLFRLGGLQCPFLK